MKICQGCGKQLKDEHIFCTYCGARAGEIKPEDTISDKRAQIAFWLSSVFPGLGHFYLKKIRKGMIFFLIGLLLFFCSVAGMIIPPYMFVKTRVFDLRIFLLGFLFCIILLLYYFYVMRHAFRTAQEEDNNKKKSCPTFLPALLLVELFMTALLNTSIIIIM